MRNKYWLRMGDDWLDQAEDHRTKADAVAAFEEVARELDRYGQRIEGSIHIAPDADTIAEYPDFVLSLGPRGGIRVERL